ncbi:MAG: calcium-binding protein, partial [Longimicrobiales bacterium]
SPPIPPLPTQPLGEDVDIFGGDGDDTFQIVVEPGAPAPQLMVDGGNGNDALQISGVASGAVHLGAGNDVVVIAFLPSAGPSIRGDFPDSHCDEGDDTIEITGGRNLTLARQGVIDGGDGNDVVNAGRFEIETASFGLAITGGSGGDTLIGSNGKDNLHGGLGADLMTGGNGADIFDYDAPAEGGDVITDFTPGSDLFHISSIGFGGGLAPGALPADRFVSGADPVAVVSGVGVFLYDTDNGALAWDDDGAGGNLAVGIAVLTSLPALTASDFLVL